MTCALRRGSRDEAAGSGSSCGERQAAPEDDPARRRPSRLGNCRGRQTPSLRRRAAALRRQREGLSARHLDSKPRPQATKLGRAQALRRTGAGALAGSASAGGRHSSAFLSKRHGKACRRPMAAAGRTALFRVQRGAEWARPREARPRSPSQSIRPRRGKGSRPAARTQSGNLAAGRSTARLRLLPWQG